MDENKLAEDLFVCFASIFLSIPLDTSHSSSAEAVADAESLLDRLKQSERFPIIPPKGE